MFKGYLTLNINQVSHFDPQCTSNFTTQSENLHYVITRQERHSEEIFRKENPGQDFHSVTKKPNAADKEL